MSEVNNSTNQDVKLRIGYSKGPVSNTTVRDYRPTWEEMQKQLRSPEIGPKDGSYFTCSSMKGERRNGNNAKEASLIVLDGDGTVGHEDDKTFGAPDPARVHEVLKKHDITHCIYNSHSNGAKGHRYRVVIRTNVTCKEELVAHVAWVIHLLHEAGVMLANVSENDDFAHAWFMPRVPDEAALEQFRFYEYASGKKFPKREMADWYIKNPVAGNTPPKTRPETVEGVYDNLKRREPQAAHALPFGMSGGGIVRKATTGQVASLLAHRAVRLKPMEYGVWQKDTMAICHWNSGEAGIEPALKYGELLGYERDSMTEKGITVERDLKDKWKGYSDKGEGNTVTLGTLIKQEKEHGWEWHASDEPEAKAEAEKELKGYKLTRLVQAMFDNHPPPTPFVVDGYAPRRHVGMLTAHGGVGKSMMALYMAMCVCTGQRFLGCKITGSKVVLISLEDDIQQIYRRLYHTVAEEDRQAVLENFVVMDRYGQETHVVTAKGGEVKVSEVPERIVEVLQEAEPDLVIVDTLVRSHSVNENDNSQMATVMVAYEKIAKELDCAVMLLHHVAKGSKDNGAGANRGASAIGDNSRSTMVLSHATDADVKGMLISDPTIVTENRLIKVTHGKHNYSVKEPDKWLEVKPGGHVVPWYPITDPRGEEAVLYGHLHQWCVSKHNGGAICKQTIRDNLEFIRPNGIKASRDKYGAALAWAVTHGHAHKACAPTGTKHPKTEFFRLDPLPKINALGVAI